MFQLFIPNNFQPKAVRPILLYLEPLGSQNNKTSLGKPLTQGSDFPQGPKSPSWV
jgi:hypothetical protein